MKVKEKLDEPPFMGFPGDGMYCLTSTSWNSKRFPTTYRENVPVGSVQPSLAEYYSEALGKLSHRIVPPKYAGVSRIEYDCSVNKQKMNYCYHNSNRLVNLPISYKLGNLYTPTYTYVAPLYRYGMSGTPRSALYYVDDVDRRARSNRAYWTMQPKFQGHIDSMNFLLELKDFTGLLRQFRSLLNLNFHKFRRSFERTCRKETLAGSVGDATGALSSTWLSFVLQWQPLLNDIADIGNNLMSQVEAAQNKFHADGEFGTIMRYSEDVETIDERVDSGENFTDVLSKGRFRKNKFTAVMHMKYDYDMRSPLSAFLKFWGLKGSVSTLWNATRLSFVVDYFIKIGKAISAMEIDENVSNVRSLKYCESYKSEDSSGLFFNASGTKRLKESLISGAPFQGSQLISGYQARSYIRMPCVPSKGLYIPLTKLPSTKQGITMLALTRSMLG